MRITCFLIGSMILFFPFACRKKSSESNPKPTAALVPTGNAIDDYVIPLGPPLQPEEGRPIQLLDDVFEKNGEYSCKTTVYKAGYSFDENLILNPQTNIIYPGALIDGNSIVTGAYKPLNLRRNGGVIISDLQVADDEGSVKVTEVSSSNVRNAITKLQNKELTSPPPANITFEITEVHSLEQMKASIGASYGNKVLDVSAGFDFSQSSVKNKFLIKFAQVYYTMSIEAPIKPSDFISAANSIEDVRREIKGAAPCYIASTTYGRMAFLFLQSNEDRKVVKASLDAVFNGGGAKNGFNAAFESDKTLKESTISGTIIGGNADDAVGAVKGKEYMLDYITKKGSFSRESPGALISYKLALLSDNSVFRMVNATQYTIRECVKNTKGVKLEGFRAWDADAQIFGRIDVVFSYEGETAETRRTLWSRTREQAVGISANSSNLGFTEKVVFNFENSKLDKAKIRVEAFLEEKDERARCDMGDLSKGQKIDADDLMEARSGSFLIPQPTKASGLEVDASSGFLFLNRVKVSADYEVGKLISSTYCEPWGTIGNPQIDVIISFIQ